jgi:hypothetical protein
VKRLRLHYRAGRKDLDHPRPDRLDLDEILVHLFQYLRVGQVSLPAFPEFQR